MLRGGLLADPTSEVFASSDLAAGPQGALLLLFEMAREAGAGRKDF